MAKKNFAKKLILKKQTITNLNLGKEELAKLYGGEIITEDMNVTSCRDSCAVTMCVNSHCSVVGICPSKDCPTMDDYITCQTQG